MRRRPDRVLLELFEQAGRNVRSSSMLLRDMLAEFPDHAGLAGDIYLCEQEGDRIAHGILQRIAQAARSAATWTPPTCTRSRWRSTKR